MKKFATTLTVTLSGAFLATSVAHALDGPICYSKADLEENETFCSYRWPSEVQPGVSFERNASVSGTASEACDAFHTAMQERYGLCLDRIERTWPPHSP